MLPLEGGEVIAGSIRDLMLSGVTVLIESPEEALVITSGKDLVPLVLCEYKYSLKLSHIFLMECLKM